MIVPLMRSMYGRALCHVSDIPLIEFLSRELRRGDVASCSEEVVVGLREC